MRKKLVSFEEPIANSSIFVLPTDIQPAFSRFSITVAEYGGIKLLRIFEPHVVLIPFVQKRSFWAIGIPAKEESDVNKIKSLLVDQIVSRVRWRESVNYMIKQGVDDFIEILQKILP